MSLFWNGQALKSRCSRGKSTMDDHWRFGIQLELSFLPLYEGWHAHSEALDLVYSLGFTLTGLLPCFIDANNGRMLQADGIFFRRGRLRLESLREARRRAGHQRSRRIAWVEDGADETIRRLDRS